MDTNNTLYPIFSVYGIELEYMIVDQNTLDVKPIADKILEALAGKLVNEVERGEIAISNELALHVIEFKTNNPKPSLAPLAEYFSREINEVNQLLQSFGAQLLPTGMHPWYDPHTGMALWPHGDRKIYETYHRIFNCSGHGWVNLQSTHINLPFSNDLEFAKLHNAIRLLLPIIPALAASTPFAEGHPSGVLDTRLLFYGKNQIKIPSIAGKIIPEFVHSMENYQEKILRPMYKAISPFDPEGILQHEWLNSRGSIARFDRHAIEIRVTDIQECPLADMSCVAVIVAACKYLVNHHEEYLVHPIETEELHFLYNQCIKFGMNTPVETKNLLRQLGLSSVRSLTAGGCWARLIELSSNYLDNQYGTCIETILSHGNLAQRLLTAYRNKSDLHYIYKEINKCLIKNSLFIP